MPRTLALKLQPGAALAVVVRSGGGRIAVEAARRISLPEGNDAKASGRAIAAALVEWHVVRLPAVVAVPRSELSVQTYDLPPAPAEDLPDLVHLQAQRDLPLADDGEGFDFLPLAGDEEHPHRVMAAGLLPNAWKLLRETCDAAELKVERVVPEPLGWPELGRHAQESDDGARSLMVFAAIIERRAVVWATEDGVLRLIRTVWLSDAESAEDDVAALAGELRRTLLSLAQSPEGQRWPTKCAYVGENAERIAGELSATLSRPVQAASLEGLVEASTAVRSESPLVEMAPLAALAASLAEHRSPPIDLLHPRRRPAPPSRARTYALAGAAAALLVALVAWKAHRNVQEPLEAAELARAQREALTPVMEELAGDEAKAAAVRRWLDESTNLLTELDYLSQQLRPEPLESDQFKAEQDMVLSKLTLANRQLTLDGSVKSSDAMTSAEGRLRAANYKVDRGPVESNSQTVPGYGVSVSDTVERVEPGAEAGGQP
jgi:hypothetical protein